ncbi:MAG: peptidase [Planctomycetaceae bacterium]|nr:peptidase [Planctomycetaceae bacterium]
MRNRVVCVARWGWISVSVLLAAGGLKSMAWAEELTPFQKAWESIQAKDARQHVTTLASDTFEGRDAGSRGGKAASIYLSQEFRKSNLQGSISPKTYFQEFGNECRNILGLLPGSDPKLKHEFIIVGAHYDHVGYGNQETSNGPVGHIHNGADDNASGVSAVLEIAEAWRTGGLQPRRSILFALWDSEEHGLLGSKHWVANPTCPLTAVRLAVNMDMIGRMTDVPLEVTGTRTLPGLRRMLSAHNRQTNLKFNFLWGVKEDSDHWSFYERKSPFVMPFSGFHADYHRPSDDVDKINFEGIQRITRWMFGVTEELANAQELPRFRPEALQETTPLQQQVEVAARTPEPRLSVKLAPVDAGPGRLLADVFPQSAAAFVGLQPGDRIIRFGDEEIQPQTNLAGLILRTDSPVRVRFIRPGQPQPQRVLLTLLGKPIRIGLNWREDPAEPGTVAINLLEAGSPSDLAGLKINDRIWQINGQDFKNGVELREKLMAAPSPVSLLIERQGQLKIATLEIPDNKKPAIEANAKESQQSATGRESKK